MSRPALEINAANGNAHYFRGLAYFYKRLFDKIVSAFNKCLELDPTLADAYFNKAVSCERSGRQEEAQEAYAAFLRYAPPEAKDQIEQARSKIGSR